jgi:hypothetical protein
MVNTYHHEWIDLHSWTPPNLSLSDTACEFDSNFPRSLHPENDGTREVLNLEMSVYILGASELADIKLVLVF